MLFAPVINRSYISLRIFFNFRQGHIQEHTGLIIDVSPFNICEEKKFEGQLNSMFAIGYSANKHYNFSLNCKIASKLETVCNRKQWDNTSLY